MGLYLELLVCAASLRQMNLTGPHGFLATLILLVTGLRALWSVQGASPLREVPVQILGPWTESVVAQATWPPSGTREREEGGHVEVEQQVDQEQHEEEGEEEEETKEEEEQVEEEAHAATSGEQLAGLWHELIQTVINATGRPGVRIRPAQKVEESAASASGRRALASELRRFLGDLSVRRILTTFPEGLFPEARGIVVCGGGRLLVPAYVTLRLLRSRGASLPIELWYAGADEAPTSAQTKELTGVLRVRLRDITAYLNVQVHGRFCAMKPLAVLLSRFRHVLLLDADSHPIRDPSFLFESAAFKSHGAIFWPDYWISARMDMWAVIGRASDAQEEFEIESGQLLVDKSRVWRALLTAAYMNLRADAYYQLTLGDKETFRFAWHATGQSFFLVPHPAGLAGYFTGQACRGHTIVQRDLNGGALFFHRNLDKFSVQHVARISHNGTRLRRAWRVVVLFPSGADRLRGRVRMAERPGGGFFIVLWGPTTNTSMARLNLLLGYDLEEACDGFLRDFLVKGMLAAGADPLANRVLRRHASSLQGASGPEGSHVERPQHVDDDCERCG